MSVLPDSFYRCFDFYAPQWVYMETIPDRAAMDVTAMWWEGRFTSMTAQGSVALQEKGWQRALQKTTPEGYTDYGYNGNWIKAGLRI